MRIPIRNVYYLLCYAWDKLDERDIVSVEPVEGQRVIDLLARVLVSGVTHLLKRGLDRGYITESEDTKYLRGKVDLTETVKRNLLACRQAHCHFDDLSYDVLHNQILKAAVHLLIRNEDIAENTRKDCISIFRRLNDVSDISISSLSFRAIQLNKHNQFYEFLLNICELILANHLPTQESGVSKFRDFDQDEIRMRTVFEAFVRNFYKKEQSEYRVSSEWIEWNVEPQNPDSKLFLPKMLTDVSLASDNRYIILDTKFTPHALRSRNERQTLHSPNLYQIHAYLQNKRPQLTGKQHLAGILLYPTTSTELDLEYHMGDVDIRVVTVDLAADWRAIHNRLLEILIF
jgi:5-methylcytosine-specific restriction enzyme subunit McrC